MKSFQASSTHEQIFAELTPIFWEIFDDDTIQPTNQMTASDIDAWDSLSHIRLIVAVEQHFKVHFTSAEVTSFANVGDFVTTIKMKQEI